ncbi:MAG: hypothetical protein U1E57_03935 [Paenacidovorax caeni]
MCAPLAVAVLLGLVLCWGIAVPWLTALAPAEHGQTLPALAGQIRPGLARYAFSVRGVIGISAL